MRDTVTRRPGWVDVGQLRGTIAAMATDGRPLVLTTAQTDPAIRAAVASLGDVADVIEWHGWRGPRFYLYSPSDRAALGL